MRGRLIVALIVLLVVADVVLVTFAVRRGQAGADVAGPRATNSTVTTDGPTQTQTPQAAAGQGLVAAADTVVLRATKGSCKTGELPALELSTDSGATFAPTAEDLGVAQVMRVAVISASEMWFVGADLQCTPSIWRSTDAGSGWSQSPVTRGVWYPLPAAAAPKIHAPSGREAVDCSVASFSAVNRQTARVLCASGTVLGTVDGGSTWTTLGDLKPAQVIAFESSESGVALGSTPSCDVQAFVTGDGGATWTHTECLQGESAQAVAYDDGSVIALVDDTLQISGDGGQTWSTP